MNGATAITEKIINDANASAKEVLDAASAQAQAVTQQYTEEAARQAGEILREAEEKAAAIKDRASSQADMERRNALLATKQEAVLKAFEAALATLCAKPEQERALLMVQLCVKYQTQDAELIFSAADQKTVGPLVVETVNAIYSRQQLKETFSGGLLEQLKKLVLEQPLKRSVSLSKTVGRFSGGFVLKEGDIEKNCTFNVLVDSLKEELEGEISSLLFS